MPVQDGDFICPYCGLTYRRKMPTPKEEQYEKNVKIMAFGHFWEQKLQECLREKKQTITQTSRTMQCTKGTVYKYARSLGVIEKSQHAKIAKPYPKSIKNSIELVRQQRRSSIKKLIDMNPEIRRSDLRRANQGDYEWLRLNDQEWFEASLPKKQDLKTNWKKRDEEWLEIITKTYERLVEYPIDLKRISIYSLFIEAGLNKD